MKTKNSKFLIGYAIRYSSKNHDIISPATRESLETALAAEDGDDYSTWPVAHFSDGTYISLINEEKNMNVDEAVGAIVAELGMA